MPGRANGPARCQDSAWQWGADQGATFILHIGRKCCLPEARKLSCNRACPVAWTQVCTANELDTIPGPLLDRMEATVRVEVHVLELTHKGGCG